MAVYPRVLSVCTGHAGLDLGIRIACPEARAVCYVEREAFAVANLVSKMQAQILDEAPIYSDLTQLDGAPWCGRVDLIIGGPPCQGWSLAGKRKGAADPRNLWPSLARIMRDVCPDALFFENTPEIFRGGYFHDTIEPDLASIGYRCEPGLFTAAEVGAPHDRCRFFFLAIAEGSGHGGRTGNKGSPQGARSGRSEAERCGASMADAGDGQLPQPRRGSEGRGGSVSTSEGLADTESKRPGEARRLRHDASAQRTAGHGEGLVHAERGGWITWGPDAGREARDAVGQPGPFPPRRDDADGWRSIIASHPHLRPAGTDREIESMVHRVADGMAPRMDRCRGCGEGVVPVVAAVAFRSLLARFD